MSIHEFAEPFSRHVNNNNKEVGGSILVVADTFTDMRQVNLYSLQTYFSHYGLRIFFSLHFVFVNVIFIPAVFKYKTRPVVRLRRGLNVEFFLCLLKLIVL